MSCKINFSLITESLTGNIGDDWKYKVIADVFNPNLTGRGTISVNEHTLTPGTSKAVPNNNIIRIPAGACATGPTVKITIEAEEVDWLIDDDETNSLTIPMECPGPGGNPYEIEETISVVVKEEPNIFGNNATLEVIVRLVAECV